MSARRRECTDSRGQCWCCAGPASLCCGAGAVALGLVLLKGPSSPGAESLPAAPPGGGGSQRPRTTRPPANPHDGPLEHQAPQTRRNEKPGLDTVQCCLWIFQCFQKRLTEQTRFPVTWDASSPVAHIMRRHASRMQENCLLGAEKCPLFHIFLSVLYL